MTDGIEILEPSCGAQQPLTAARYEVSRMSRPKAVSLYTGAGGLDYGVESAGFEIAAAIELDHDSCETIRASRSWAIIERSIFDTSSEEIMEVAAVRPGEIDLVIGGPPCQPFSKAGYWANGDSRRLDDPRAGTLGAYLRVIEDVQPRAFLLENVTGIGYVGKDEGLRMLLDGLRCINARTKSSYRPVVQVLNAASYGVPQVRERVFVVAAREGSDFSFPPPTHVDDGQPDLLCDDEPQLEPFRTCWDALGDLPSCPDEDLAVRGKWADLLPSIPEGNNYLWHTDRGGGRPLFGWRRRYWSFLLKLAKARPAWTIQAQPGPAIGPFHWCNRRLSVRELCRLQTFPDDVVIVGGRTSIQRQIGNAVPSLLAEVIARAIRSQLLGLQPMRGSPKLLPAARHHVPPPEGVSPVPPRFRDLEGTHSPHPGTGHGTRASRRKIAIPSLDGLGE